MEKPRKISIEHSGFVAKIVGNESALGCEMTGQLKFTAMLGRVAFVLNLVY